MYGFRFKTEYFLFFFFFSLYFFFFFFWICLSILNIID